MEKYWIPLKIQVFGLNPCVSPKALEKFFSDRGFTVKAVEKQRKRPDVAYIFFLKNSHFQKVLEMKKIRIHNKVAYIRRACYKYKKEE